MDGRCRVKLEAYNDQRGAQLVELALILPLFLVLLTGIIEFGRGYNVYQNVIHATREGVRAAAPDCLTGGNCTPANASTLSDTEIKNRIRDHLKGINIDAADSDIVIDANTPLALDGFKTDPSVAAPSFARKIAVYRVRVNYTYTANTSVTVNLPSEGPPPTITVSRVSVNYPFSFFIFGPVIKLLLPTSPLGGNITLRTSVTMENQS